MVKTKQNKETTTTSDHGRKEGLTMVEQTERLTIYKNTADRGTKDRTSDHGRKKTFDHATKER